MTGMAFAAHAAPEAPPEPLVTRWWRTVDRWTLGAVLSIVVLGLVLVLAASAPMAERLRLDPLHFASSQVMFAAMGLALMLLVSAMPVRWVRRAALLGCLAGVVALLLLPEFGTNHGKGATRWFSIAGQSVQPVEFLKPCFAIAAAWLLSACEAPGGPPGRTLSLGLAATIAFLLALQPDYGQAALVMATWGVMYFVSGASILVIALVGTAAAGAGMFAYSVSGHVQGRINDYLAADVDPRSQLGYALHAIREGGLMGVGMGGGSVKSTLPDAHTDFIIAVAAEEYGLLACWLVMALFLLITLRAFLRLTAADDPFQRLAGAGLAAMIGLQAFVNLGVATRLLPTKGMTLPFISYGGSSMIATCLAMGALLAMTRRPPRRSDDDPV